MSQTDPALVAPAVPPSPSKRRPTAGEVLHDIAAGSITRTLAAIVLSLAIATVFIIFTNEDVQRTLGYVFNQPADFFAAAGRAVSDAYIALFRGAIYNTRADDFATGIKPLTESLRFAGPLIAAGLGIALTFRAGLFNIGGQGQMVMGAVWSAWAAFQLHLPWGVHLIVAIIFGLVGAGLWAGIAGWLKAKTGAHEVIVTIMMNYIAVSLTTYLMRTPVLHDMESGSNPTTRPPDPRRSSRGSSRTTTCATRSCCASSQSSCSGGSWSARPSGSSFGWSGSTRMRRAPPASTSAA